MNKQEFKQKTQEILDQLEAKIDEMKVGVANVAEEAKEEYAEQLDKLGKLKEDLTDRLNRFDTIADSKWDVVKESAANFFETVSGSWKDNYAKVVEAFKKAKEDLKEEEEENPTN